MEVKKLLLTFFFTFIFLLHPSSAICVKRNATMFQFSATSNAQPVAAPVNQPASQPVQPPTSQSSTPAPPQQVQSPPHQATTPSPAQPAPAPQTQATTPSSPTPPVQPMDSPDEPPKEMESPERVQPLMEAPDQQIQTTAMDAPDQPLIPTSMEAPDQSVQQAVDPSNQITISPAQPEKPKPTTTHASPEIDKMCKQTDYADLCISLIPPSTKPEPKAVLGILVEKGKEETNAALAAAEKFVAGSSQRGMAGTTIEVCQESYADAIDNFNNAMTAMAKDDTATMNTMLSAAMTNYDTCDTGFAELPGAAASSPLTSYDEKLTQLTSVCLAIASLIK